MTAPPAYLSDKSRATYAVLRGSTTSTGAAVSGGYRLRKLADLLDVLPPEHERIQHLFVARPYDKLTKDPIMHLDPVTARPN